MSAPSARPVEIRYRGKDLLVPGLNVGEHTFVVTGRWIKVAMVRDEQVACGDPCPQVDAIVSAMQRAGIQADMLTLLQRPPNVAPKFAHHVEWENYAAMPIVDFASWWNNLPRVSRSNVTRAAKRGVEVRTIEFDDELAHGIHRICNETSVRQGRLFWHFGKSFEQVRREHATYLDRSQFLGAYVDGALVGYVKLVFVDKIASIMNILGLISHRDKRPMNALLSKAVELCTQRGVEYLVYGNYTYGNKRGSSLAEFKRRNGFKKLNYPRYYVPLTLKGRLYVSLRLYRGAIGLIPGSILNVLLKIRSQLADWNSAAAVPTLAAVPRPIAPLTTATNTSSRW
jgi:hypothetical protein